MSPLKNCIKISQYNSLQYRTPKMYITINTHLCYVFNLKM
nr:MAG TPA: hypothetical protein [Caudoviricetes sp.]